MYIPWPRGWELWEPRRKLALAGLIPIGILFLLVGVVASLRGAIGIGWGSLLSFAVVVVIGVMAYVSVIAPKGRGSGAVDSGDVQSRSATILSQSPAANRALVLFWLAATVMFVSTPALANAMPHDGSRQSTAFHSAAPFVPALAIPLLAYLFSRVVRKRGLLGVGLTPEGVYHWWWFGCSFFAWEWIDRVRLANPRELAVVLDVREPPDRPVNEEENWFGRWAYYREKRRKFYVGYLAVNPAVAYYALAFYQRHPELRAELGTPEGVRRIQQLDFPELVSEMERYGDLQAPDR